MKKLLIAFIVVTASVFVISFITSDKLNIGERVLSSMVFGIFGALAFCANGGRSKRLSTANKKSTSKSNTIYVFPYGQRQFKYRVKNGYVYEGMNNRFVYRIDKGKIYKGMSASPLFCIEGDRIYHYAGNRNVAYKIKENLIYQGELSRVPIYEQKTSAIGK